MNVLMNCLNLTNKKKLRIMIKKFHIYCAIGIIALILSVKCACCDKLADIVYTGFVSILLITGLTFTAIGLTTPIEEKKNKDTQQNKTI